jgi:large subunit ribosomal protein L25
MAQRSLAAEVRSEVGKNAARRLRGRGRIPGIVYGHTANRLISIDEREFSHSFKTVSESTVVTLKLPEGDVDVLVKDYQEDLLAGRIVHLDFFEIDPNKTLRTHVQLRFEGSPVGVREGGILETLTHEIEIECLSKDLPESISVDISALQIGQSIHVRNVTPPPGVSIRTTGDQTVCLVAVHKVVEEKPAEVAVEGAIPEGGEAMEAASEKGEEQE